MTVEGPVLYMYAEDINERNRIRLIKLCEFPMRTICYHGLTSSDLWQIILS